MTVLAKSLVGALRAVALRESVFVCGVFAAPDGVSEAVAAGEMEKPAGAEPEGLGGRF